MKYIDYVLSFAIGAILYSAIEIIWRGHTHWTMTLVGGLCLSFIHYLRKKCPNVSLTLRCFTGAVFICTMEFITGFIVNIMLSWNVWDYTSRAFNICGQICLPYAVLWFLLCLPANTLSALIEKLSKNKTLSKDNINVQ